MRGAFRQRPGTSGALTLRRTPTRSGPRGIGFRWLFRKVPEPPAPDMTGQRATRDALSLRSRDA